MEIELKNEGSDSFQEKNPSKSDDEVEPQTLTLSMFDRVRRSVERYSPSNFCSSFTLSTINDDSRFVKEEVNFEQGKPWK